MNKIHMSPNNSIKHQCISSLDSNWIIWSCPVCGYIRKFNWKEQKMESNGGDQNVMHYGEHSPTGINIKNIISSSN